MRVVFADAGAPVGDLLAAPGSGAEAVMVVTTGEPVPRELLEALWDAHGRSEAVLTVAARTGGLHGDPAHVLVTDADGRLLGVQSVREPAEALSDLVPAGVYVVAPEALEYLPEEARDWVTDVLPALLAYDAPVLVRTLPAAGQTGS